MQAGKGFAESLMKRVSSNFFCCMKMQKKALLGLRFFGCNQMGKTTG
jgi:hypothetical protein